MWMAFWIRINNFLIHVAKIANNFTSAVMSANHALCTITDIALKFFTERGVLQFLWQKPYLLSVYFAGLDQALEGCHARVTLIAIPLKCEWNPFVVGSLLMLFVCYTFRCPGMLGPWQTRVPLALKRMQGFKVDTHTHTQTHSCIMHIAQWYPSNESVHIPAICVVILSYQLHFSYSSSTSLVWLMLWQINDSQQLVYCIYTQKKSLCSPTAEWRCLNYK